MIGGELFAILEMNNDSQFMKGITYNGCRQIYLTQYSMGGILNFLMGRKRGMRVC